MTRPFVGFIRDPRTLEIVDFAQASDSSADATPDGWIVDRESCREAHDIALEMQPRACRPMIIGGAFELVPMTRQELLAAVTDKAGRMLSEAGHTSGEHKDPRAVLLALRDLIDERDDFAEALAEDEDIPSRCPECGEDLPSRCPECGEDLRLVCDNCME